MLSLLEKQEEQFRMGKLDEAAKEIFNNFKAKVKKILPRQILRRAQAS